LQKYVTPYLTIPTLLASSVLFSITFTHYISLLSKSCYYRVHQLSVFVFTLILKRQIQSPPLSSSLNVIIVTLCYNFAKSQIIRLQETQTLARAIVKATNSHHTLNTSSCQSFA